MKTLSPLLALVAALAASLANAQEINAVGTQIAETMGYPAERLVITDESARYAEKTKGQSIAVLSLKSKDDTFAATGIAIGRKGVLMKPELEADCQEKIAQGSSTIKRFELDRGIYGYSGLGIAGPGGSEERMIATWPERGIDLQIKMTIPREGVQFDESTKAYHDLVTQGGTLLVEKMLKGMGQLVAHVERTNLRATEGSATKSPDANAPDESNTNGLRSSSAASNAGAQTPTPSVEKPTSSTPWSVVVVLIVAAIGLLWFLLKRRS